MFGLVLLYASVGTADLGTLKFQSYNTYPPPNSPRPVGPFANIISSANNQKPCTALYLKEE
jgi:hypothetical protein